MGLKTKQVAVLNYKEYIEEEKEPFKGAGFTLLDDEWDLSYRETRATNYSKLKFHDIEEWLKPTVKEFIAQHWLFYDFSNSILVNYLRAFKIFNNYIIEFRNDTKNISDLDRSITLGFKQFVETEMKPGRTQSTVYTTMIKYSEFLRKNHTTKVHKDFYFENGKFNSDSQRINSYSQLKDKAIPLDVCYKVMKALKEEEKELYEILKTNSNKNNQLNTAKNRLIYCQILKLIIATGRRSSHVINIDRSPLRETVEDEANGVWLIWNETKTKQGLQEVYVPEPLSEVVKEAVKIAQEVTEGYVNQASAEDKNSLFLIYGHPKNGGNKIRKVEYKNILSFVNGAKNREGFMKKHSIIHQDEVYRLKLHGFRHTRFNEMRKNGAGIGTIQNDAKHLSTDMTSVYINGDEIAKKEFFQLVDKEEMIGDMSEFIKNKNVRMDKFTEKELERYKKNGMFIQTTHYGYCHLEIEVGPCPSGDPCWIGQEGCGCKYHLFGQSNMVAIEEDVEMYKEEMKREQENSPNSPIIGHYESILARYEEVKKQVECKCGGKNCGK